MKLNDQTVSILKNFSTINQNLVIKEGSEIATMSAMKNIVAKATVEENFPVEFAIYDLNEFLSALSLFTNPDLDFQENYVVITEAGSKGKSLKYWYSEPSVVTTPSKEVTMPSSEVKFPLQSNVLSEVQKAAAVIGAPDMVLEDDELRVTDKRMILQILILLLLIQSPMVQTINSGSRLKILNCCQDVMTLKFHQNVSVISRIKNYQ